MRDLVEPDTIKLNSVFVFSRWRCDAFRNFTWKTNQINLYLNINYIYQIHNIFAEIKKKYYKDQENNNTVNCKVNMKRFQKRKCDMWISNNKVLIGGAKKPHARNPNFETEETKLLISLWGDPKIQKTLITTHKKHPVIMRLADKMREHGYYRSAEEINTRIKNLKCFYNRIKKDVELGIITEPTWKHYSAMEEIINRPVFGNRVQQPHLLHLQAKQQEEAAADESSASKADISVDDDDSNGFRPEDLLSVEEDSEQEMDFEDGTLVTKEEPVDIDEMEQIPEER